MQASTFLSPWIGEGTASEEQITFLLRLSCSEDFSFVRGSCVSRKLFQQHYLVYRCIETVIFNP